MPENDAIFVPTSSLKPGFSPRSKEHEDAQVEYLKCCFSDLKERQLVPIIALSDGTIIDGHCRWRALSEIKKKHAWVVYWPSNRGAPTEDDISRINASQSHVIPPAEMMSRMFSLAERGWTAEKLALAMGRSERAVADELRIWRKLTPDEREEAVATKASVHKLSTVVKERSAWKNLGAKLKEKGKTKAAPAVVEEEEQEPVKEKKRGAAILDDSDVSDVKVKRVKGSYVIVFAVSKKTVDEQGAVDDLLFDVTAAIKNGLAVQTEKDSE